MIRMREPGANALLTQNIHHWPVWPASGSIAADTPALIDYGLPKIRLRRMRRRDRHRPSATSATFAGGTSLANGFHGRCAATVPVLAFSPAVPPARRR
jgi:hypothetical protein